VNAGPSAEDGETEANTVAALHACAPYLVWYAYRESFDDIRDDTRHVLATPISHLLARMLTGSFHQWQRFKPTTFQETFLLYNIDIAAGI